MCSLLCSRRAFFLLSFFFFCQSAEGQSPSGTFAKVCVISDKTGSSQRFETPQITTEDLVPLLDQMYGSTGGEIGWGLLDENSGTPLKRLYIRWLPELPVRKRGRNARSELENARNYNEELALWVETRDERADRFQVEREHFFESIAPDIARPDTSRVSDVAGALVRCARFLAEPDPTMMGLDFMPFILFISDVEHAVTREYLAKNPDIDLTIPSPRELDIIPIIFVVNGKQHKGTLAQSGYSVRAFEGINAAVRTILNQTEFDEVN